MCEKSLCLYSAWQIDVRNIKGSKVSKHSDDSKKDRWWPWLLLFLGVIILWGILWALSSWGYPKIEERGQFGDSFGGINALFAGLAFAGVIWAILLQKKELELQRKELEETRAEIRGQKEQLQAQNQTLQKQNFESSFFQLLSMHGEIVNSIVTSRMDREYSVRRCFTLMLRDMYNNTAQVQNNTSEKKFLNSVYEEVFDEYQQYIGHYFLYLYQVVKFVDRSDQEAEAKKFYTDLIRAQLSSDELGLLFYHSLSDRGAKFKDLVEKYALFEDMPSEVLIDEVDEEHRKLYKPSAYGESG